MLPTPALSDAHTVAAPPGTAVLADPTGRRARRMRLAGRSVAVAFTVWICALMLAGLDLLPSGSVPLEPRVHAAAAPQSPSSREPAVGRAGSPAARVPATAFRPAVRPLPRTPAGVHRALPATGLRPSPLPRRPAARERSLSGSPPAASPTPNATTPPGNSPRAARPGAPPKPKPTRGKSATAPGHTRTSAPKLAPRTQSHSSAHPSRGS
jgi:hypothetical protein